MRTTLGAFLIIVGLSVSASAQSLLQVDITEGEFRAGMQAVTTPYATGGPWAAIPARALKPDVTPTVSDFRIRTWVEGVGARVIVFAVTRKPGTPLGSDDEREVQIASVFVTAGQSVVIDATEKFNARPITVRAVDRSTEPVDVRALVEEARRLRALVAQPR
jgi:hypothetical protein